MREFYSDQDSPWIQDWTSDHGVTERFSYLTASLVNSDLRLPLVSIPSPMGNDMPSEISIVLDIVLPLLDHIDFLSFDLGFYSRDMIISLNQRKMNYLIFVPRNPQVKEELYCLSQNETKYEKN